MPMPTSKKNAGLGRAIMNRRAKDAKTANTSTYHTTDTGTAKPSWMKLQSVTQEGDLEEFLNTAQMADTDFTAEKRNATVISAPGASKSKTVNPFLLSGEEEEEVRRKHAQNKARLRVPRRPRWSPSDSKEQLERSEKDAFLEWRRGLAELQEGTGFVLTPFERNIEVWRQLWRVIERSDLLVQIVDARNPLRFRCEDLEAYVSEMGRDQPGPSDHQRERRNLLLINKADLLDEEQRKAWASYFASQGIAFAFFSAANAAFIQAMNDGTLDAGMAADEELLDRHRQVTEESSRSSQHSPSRILTISELEALFDANAPPPEKRESATRQGPSRVTVGLVGYPNVGKSSTINALLGAKKVSVSSTPGKTKHFQTLLLSEETVLCDCPGLVFPQFATTAAELVVDGVLPIDQLREYTGPADLVAKRIPKDIIEGTYGFQIASEQPDTCTGLEILTAYALARGFARQGQGNPDESRSARYVLKDYVNAKLLYAHPPGDIDADEFNAAQRERVRARLVKAQKMKARGAPTAPDESGSVPTRSARDFDSAYFRSTQGAPHTTGRRGAPAVLQGRVSDTGEVLAGGAAGGAMSSSKKHFKNKRTKGKPIANPYDV